MFSLGIVFPGLGEQFGRLLLYSGVAVLGVCIVWNCCRRPFGFGFNSPKTFLSVTLCVAAYGVYLIGVKGPSESLILFLCIPLEMAAISLITLIRS